MFKLGWLPDGVHDEPYSYPNVWALEHTSGPDRLVAAPKSKYVELIDLLLTVMSEPFGLLYILAVPRGEGEPGRYQCPEPLSSVEVRRLLSKYERFLEGDGRQSLWIRSMVDGSMLIYDRHNVIYGYGPLVKFVELLRVSGLTEADQVPFPDPHAHHYNGELDPLAQSILQEYEWLFSPLRPGDINPGE